MGSSSNPGPGDWGKIIISPTSSGSRILHAWIGYGGSGTSYGNLVLRTSQVEVSNNTLTYSAWSGIFISGIAPGVTLDIQDNQFISNTQWAVYANESGIQSSIQCSGNTSLGSPNNGIGIRGTLNSQATYTGQTDFPMVVDGYF